MAAREFREAPVLRPEGRWTSGPVGSTGVARGKEFRAPRHARGQQSVATILRAQGVLALRPEGR